ncbi:RHS repeat-associated core domain-containing protein [Streptomyces sp. NPDC005820]|uniref:RHS repeat-associated core domain-containing protein n=1 Tax=Streptomyces sp. NPDC005820 TaxID=3157069 RepID=UPI0033E1A57D
MGSSAAAGKVRVEVLDRAATQRAKVPGVLLRLQHPDGGIARTAVEVDYSGFRNAYGGDYGSRLTLARVPDCALTTPDRAGCTMTTPVASHNDAGTAKVSAEVTDGLFAVTAAASGNAGSFKPTSLSPSAIWQVGLQSGDFEWSYPFDVPEVPGLEPTIGLSYSSGGVDGRVASTNNQTSWVGEGFGFQPGFIERSYKPCSEDGEATTVGDLCWSGSNAVVSLPGATGELVQDSTDPTKWRVAEDEGWRVEPLTEAVNGDTGDAGKDNGEHWRLTSPDGTQYYFGLGRLPGWTAGKPETNSTWTAPVFGNGANEPCHQATFAASWCQQAYRWNLDYVVDPRGDAMSYWYERETNYYGRTATATATAPTPYTRGGYLSRIDYGQRADTLYSVPASASVAFSVADRCVPGTSCVQSQPQNWPDTPWDQSCGATSCSVFSPTFWSTKRLAKVTTQVLSGGGLKPVTSWTLTQSYPKPSDPTSPALWLDSITQTGYAEGAAVSLPPVTFDGEEFPNRVDAPDAYYPMYKRRISNISTESGGKISVEYKLPQCERVAVPAEDNNSKRCFPVLWDPSSPGPDWFHKRVVGAVTEEDLVGGNPTEVTTYDYDIGGHAWHHDDAELVPDKRKTWSQWSGFTGVKVRSGAVGANQTLTEYTFLRGMDGDINKAGEADKDVMVDGVPDKPMWRGFARKTTVYNGDGGPWTEQTVSEPDEVVATAVRHRTGLPDLVAYRTQEKSERTLTALSDGTVRTTETSYHYGDDGFGMVDRIEDRGDLSVPDDDRCTRLSYTRNTEKWITDTVSREETVGVNCDTTQSYPADLISDERHYYDGQDTWGAAPKMGAVTRSEEAASWSNGPVYRSTGAVELDSHGRATKQWDALGNLTKVSYTPALGGPVTKVTTTNPLGHTSSTVLHPLLGSPVTTVDANGRQTDLTYDALGRLNQVWLPGRSKATQTPSSVFEYTVRTDRPSTVTTNTLLGNESYRTGYTLYDGFLRLRQTQQPSPQGGRVITDTFYDSHGRTDKAYAGYWNADSAPTDELFGLPQDARVPAETQYEYDGAGRETAEIFVADGQEKWRTTTAYGGNRTSEDPPDGGTATMEITDADDRVVALRQYTGGSPTGSYDETRYTYTKSGDLATVTDPAGNVWRYQYDLRGRKVRAEDPDAGTTAFTYDDEDQLLSTTDARGRTLAYSYDALGRKTGLYEGSPSGARLAEWTYDTVAGGLGLPAAATRFSNGRKYSTETLGYDSAGRPTGSAVVIPGAETGSSSEYVRFESKLGYNAAGQVVSAELPAAGGLSAEKLEYTYDGLGLPDTMTSGLGTYVNSTSYTQLGEVDSYELGAGGAAQVIRSFGYEDGTRRLSAAAAKTVDASAETTVADVRYGYDAAGNVLRVADGAVGDTQCFRYDYLRRLTEAWAVAAEECGDAPGLSVLGGPAPYWQSLRYDKVGNRTGEVRHAAGGDTTRSYVYPAAGGVQPHTVRSVVTSGPGGSRTDTFGYDASGNTTQRPGQVLDWDAEGHLTSVTEGAKSTSYLYDADGNRLIRRDPDGTTVYLGDTELRRSNSGSVVGTRYYSHNASTVAVRTAGGLTWLVTDTQGTAGIAINAVTLAVTRRYQLPFGGSRGSTVAWPGEKGFVGGTTDGSTGLVHLGAREYDADTGRFTSVDPIIDVFDPQQMHGYAYANNSPVTFSDPDGLKPDCGTGKGCTAFNNTHRWTGKNFVKSPKPKKAAPKVTKPTAKPAKAKSTPSGCGAKCRKESGCTGHNGCGAAGNPVKKVSSSCNAKCKKDGGFSAGSHGANVGGAGMAGLDSYTKTQKKMRKEWEFSKEAAREKYHPRLDTPGIKSAVRRIAIVGSALTFADSLASGDSAEKAVTKTAADFAIGWAGAKAGAIIGAEAGIWFGPVGAAGGALIGATIGGVLAIGVSDWVSGKIDEYWKE